MREILVPTEEDASYVARTVFEAAGADSDGLVVYVLGRDHTEYCYFGGDAKESAKVHLYRMCEAVMAREQPVTWWPTLPGAAAVLLTHKGQAAGAVAVFDDRKDLPGLEHQQFELAKVGAEAFARIERSLIPADEQRVAEGEPTSGSKAWADLRKAASKVGARAGSVTFLAQVALHVRTGNLPAAIKLVADKAGHTAEGRDLIHTALDLDILASKRPAIARAIVNHQERLHPDVVRRAKAILAEQPDK